MSESVSQSDSQAVNQPESAADDTSAAARAGLKLDGVFAKKVGMSSVYGDAGEIIPVTVLKYEPLIVSQVKTKEKDGYEAIQVAFGPKRAVRTSDAERGHLKRAGFENGASFIREMRQSVPAGADVGARVSIESLQKGDVVRVTSRSKGRGFAGSVKRWNFAGGPASHGSKFHRAPGSSGNRTWPGRIMPGKKFPGHLGDETVTVKSVKIVDVLVKEGVILVKGPVPGGRHTLVRLVKE